MRRIVTELARQAPRLIGSPVFFIGLLTIALLWIVAGPLTGFSSGWALIPSAAGSIVALLLLVLLQFTQNRDTRAVQLKLDEVIRALDAARTELLGLERLTDDELDAIEAELAETRERHQSH